MSDKSEKNTQKYYDQFSKSYEAHRHYGYHKLIDDLEFNILKDFIKDKNVLEAGCGTGLILKRCSDIAKKTTGVDLSPGMLEQAKKRGLDCVCASLTSLPFDDSTFDVTYSFKVLPHVPDIEAAIKEMSRVTRFSGKLVLEFYNPFSIRGLIKKLKSPSDISGTTSDDKVFTRYDNLKAIKSYLPENLKISKTSGIRIATPFAGIYKVPILKNVFSYAEHRLKNSPLKYAGGFLVVVIDNQK